VGYRLVGYRRLQRDDDRFARDGFHKHDLGHLSDRLGRSELRFAIAQLRMTPLNFRCGIKTPPVGQISD
jgi:hypothetical protein